MPLPMPLSYLLIRVYTTHDPRYKDGSRFPPVAFIAIFEDWVQHGWIEWQFLSNLYSSSSHEFYQNTMGHIQVVQELNSDQDHLSSNKRQSRCESFSLVMIVSLFCLESIKTMTAVASSVSSCVWKVIFVVALQLC